MHFINNFLTFWRFLKSPLFKTSAIPSETECAHWHLMKRSLYLIINICSSSYEVFSTLYNMCEFTSQNDKKEDGAEGHLGRDAFPLPFLPTSLRTLVMTAWFHPSVSPYGSWWGKLRMLLLKRKGKKNPHPSRKWLLKLNTESALHYEFLLHALA